MKVDLIEHYGTDLSVVNAARVSFDQESAPVVACWSCSTEQPYHDDTCSNCGADNAGWENETKLAAKDVKLVHYLAKHKHTSCFEHQGATLRLKVPIFIARQIQRHRTFSYNEVSRRYVDTPPEFFWPDKWRKRAENVKQGSSDEAVDTLCVSDDKWETTPQDVAEAALRHALFAYSNMLEGGVAPELARMILPQNMYTEFYMTSNLRAWSHFLKLRLDSHAQYEVRVVAEQVKDILTPLFPVSMEALLKYD